MKLPRRSALGGLLAAFVYFAYACATGSEDARTGFDDDAGTVDAGKDAARVIVEDDSGRPGEEDTGAPKCDGKVVINELMTAGASASDEFVELYNAGTCAVSMTGWKLAYRAQSGNLSAGGLHTFAIGAQIPAKGHLVLGGSAFKGKVEGTLTNSMAADRGQVGLLDEQGKLVDGVAYGTGIMTDAGAGTFAEKTPAPGPDANGSIARKADGVDSDNNATDFAKATPHTAGAPN